MIKYTHERKYLQIIKCIENEHSTVQYEGWQINMLMSIEISEKKGERSSGV